MYEKWLGNTWTDYKTNTETLIELTISSVIQEIILYKPHCEEGARNRLPRNLNQKAEQIQEDLQGPFNKYPHWFQKSKYIAGIITIT